ncbi:MAG: MarR family transcriptional regulator [Bacteroidota bacterium]
MISKSKNQLGASIVQAGRLLTNRINSHFLALGTNITFEQMEVLVLLSVNPKKKIIQNDLAVISQKNKSGILRIIDILEKKRFVKRIPVEGDRRKNIIEATEAGIKIGKEAIELFMKIDKELTRKIHKSDVITSNKVLDIIKKECKPGKDQIDQ